jgi:PPOX class probable F420-dependent enzyme
VPYDPVRTLAVIEQSQGILQLSTVAVQAEFRDLVDNPILAYLSTVSASGVPTVSPIWFEYTDGHVVFSTQDQTRKRRNCAANPNVALCIGDPTDPYRYIELRGVVVEMTADGAHAHLDAMSQRYTHEPVFPGHDYSVPRSLVTVRLDRVITQPAV